MVETHTRILGIAPYDGMRTAMEQAAQAYRNSIIDPVRDLLPAAEIAANLVDAVEIFLDITRIEDRELNAHVVGAHVDFTDGNAFRLVDAADVIDDFLGDGEN